jgi:hypothetical protein
MDGGKARTAVESRLLHGPVAALTYPDVARLVRAAFAPLNVPGARAGRRPSGCCPSLRSQPRGAQDDRGQARVGGGDGPARG